MLKRLRTVCLVIVAGYTLALCTAPRPDYMEIVKSNPAYRGKP